MFGCGHDDFKLPLPYPDLTTDYDFPWAPKVLQMKLRSGKNYVKFFTGSYEPFPEYTGHKWITTCVRKNGTQQYANGDKFVGEFENYNGTPSKGVYTFANGDTLTGIFTGVSHGEIHPNTISVGTFYNKFQDMSYTGQWDHSTTGETSLMGYILVNYDPHSTVFDHMNCQVFYYRNKIYYEDFNKWIIDQSNKDEYLLYDPVPFPIDHTLHPESPEIQFIAKFEHQINEVLHSQRWW